MHRFEIVAFVSACLVRVRQTLKKRLRSAKMAAVPPPPPPRVLSFHIHNNIYRHRYIPHYYYYHHHQQHHCYYYYFYYYHYHPCDSLSFPLRIPIFFCAFFSFLFSSSSSSSYARTLLLLFTSPLSCGVIRTTRWLSRARQTSFPAPITNQ